MGDERWAAWTDRQLDAALAAHLDHLTAMSAHNIGFPAATDIDVAALAPFLGFMCNNLNDPYRDGQYPIHTKRFETEVCEMVADLLAAPTDDRWGYVTSGATEGNEHGLYLARERFPTGLAYVSAAAHPTLGAILGRLRMDHVVLRTIESGEMDYDDLAAELRQHRNRPAIVVACIGTPLTEAVDDVARISGVLDEMAITRRWIHADAALSGIPLALLDTGQRPRLDFAAGTRSIVVSGHKFPSTPVVSGVFLTRNSDRPYPGRAATYTGSPDSTWANSRSGFAALCLWYTLRRHGIEGLRARAEQSRDVAGYTHRRLVEIGWPAWRHNPLGFTVVLTTPPPELVARWSLPVHGGLSHIICMPGVTKVRIDAFLRDLAAAGGGMGGGAGASRAGADRPNGVPVEGHRPPSVLARLARARRFHHPT
jgi:histidine decarboxylase